MKDKKILLVEDDPDHADLIIDILDTENKKEVILKTDGQLAIDYLQKNGIADNDNKNQLQVGLVVLDLNLPKVKGMDVLKFIRGDSRYSSLPVVILSTSSNDETITEAYRNGANAFMTKPISYEEFVEKIRTLNVYC